MKVHGLRSASAFAIGRETRVACLLDWMETSNASYLGAGLVLAPRPTDGDPLSTPDFLRVEYIGVPPRAKGRLLVAVRNGGIERNLFTEGWPEKNRDGRALSRQALEIVLREGALEVWENATLLYASKEKVVLFDSAHLYLRMSSHSNYPARHVGFDDVRVSGF